jgi:hypothetical protein
MNYNDMLQYLQGLLGNQQTTQASQWQQGLGFSQQELQQQANEYAQQMAYQQAQLSQQGSEFGQSLGEQTAARLAANKLAQEQQTQSEQGQKYSQQQQTLQSSPGYLQLLSSLGDSSSADAYVKDYLNRIAFTQWKSAHPQYSDISDKSMFYQTTPAGNAGPVNLLTMEAPTPSKTSSETPKSYVNTGKWSPMY